MGIEPTMDLVSPSLDLKSRAPTRCTATPMFPKVINKLFGVHCIRNFAEKQAQKRTLVINL
jgi:hypothetical protein